MMKAETFKTGVMLNWCLKCTRVKYLSDYLFLLAVSTIVDLSWIRWHVLIFPSLGVRGFCVVSMLSLRVPGNIHCHVCGAEQLFLAWAKFIISCHVRLLPCDKYEVI